jgi:hypothetical protein
VTQLAGRAPSSAVVTARNSRSAGSCCRRRRCFPSRPRRRDVRRAHDLNQRWVGVGPVRARVERPRIGVVERTVRSGGRMHQHGRRSAAGFRLVDRMRKESLVQPSAGESVVVARYERSVDENIRRRIWGEHRLGRGHLHDRVSTQRRSDRRHRRAHHRSGGEGSNDVDRLPESSGCISNRHGISGTSALGSTVGRGDGSRGPHRRGVHDRASGRAGAAARVGNWSVATSTHSVHRRRGGRAGESLRVTDRARPPCRHDHLRDTRGTPAQPGADDSIEERFECTKPTFEVAAYEPAEYAPPVTLLRTDMHPLGPCLGTSRHQMSLQDHRTGRPLHDVPPPIWTHWSGRSRVPSR